MYDHLVLLASSYTLGKRIAWHYSAKKIDKSVTEEVKTKTKKILHQPMFALHRFPTESTSWESVVKMDSYFADLDVYDSLDDFLYDIKKDQTITALDVAKALLSMKKMTNLKLQKMVYLVYADYLSKTKKPLFAEKILAYQYGPVIKEVYDEYKIYGRDSIEDIDDSDEVGSDFITRPIIHARFAKAPDHNRILESIQETMKKYGDKTASQLVSITHRPGSPWDHSYIDGIKDQVIPDEKILKHHHVEAI